MYPVILVFIGAIIAAVGALWTSLQQAQFERELRAKSDEIAELNRTIVASVTGGNSFCYLAFALGDGTTNSFPLMLVHEGDYPIYDNYWWTLFGLCVIPLYSFAAMHSVEAARWSNSDFSPYPDPESYSGSD